jgi:hypothetical protein
MGIIRAIRLKEIESNLKEITELSLQIRLFQEEREDVAKQALDDKRELSQGDISKDVFDKNMSTLALERKRLGARIDAAAERIESLGKKLLRTAKENII